MLACLSAAIGVWFWVDSQPVKGLDACFYDAWDKVWGEGTAASAPVLLGSGKALPTEKVPHRTMQHQYPEVAYAMLDAKQVASHFHAAPIQPLDFAVLLDAVRKGWSRLAVSSPLGWKDPCEPLVQETLRRKLRDFAACVLGLRGRTASRPEFTPAELAGSALDPSRIEGSIAFVPSANASLPNALSAWGGGSFGNWALDWIEGEALMREGRASGASYPLLVRWHGDIYPTLPLRLVLLAEGVQPGEVSVEIGSHISWKQTRLPLDSYGRTTLEQGCRTRAVTLGELMEERGKGPDPSQDSYLLLCEPVASLPGEEARAEWMAATVSRLACRSTEHTEWTERPIAGRPLHRVSAASWVVSVVVGVALLSLIVVPGRSKSVHFGVEVAVLLLLLVVLGWVIEGGGWLPVAPWLAAWVVWCAGGRLLRLGRARRRR